MRGPDELDNAFAIAASEKVEALLVFSHGFAVLHDRRIIEAAAKKRLPACTAGATSPKGGGLFSYGPDIRAMVRKAASYVDRIVKGENPGDLPVEQPTKFERACPCFYPSICVRTGKVGRSLRLQLTRRPPSTVYP